MASFYKKLKQKPDLRIVLVGKSGAGKSASGNTILGTNAFLSLRSPSIVTSECQKTSAEFEGQKIAVVDTPGLFDTSKTEKEVKKEVARCISFAAPGPHVFLVVIEAGRFTIEEKETVEIIQKLFGAKAGEYTMALFTHGDDLIADRITIKDFIVKSAHLNYFISQCHGGYHVFNNRKEDTHQVRELLNKINKMVKTKRKTDKFYTSKMFQEAERAIIQEMEQLQRRHPGMQPHEARGRAERDNAFTRGIIRVSLAVAGAAAGAGIEIAVGAAVGSVAGPLGAAAGAAVGYTAAVATVAVRNNRCVIQ